MQYDNLRRRSPALLGLLCLGLTACTAPNAGDAEDTREVWSHDLLSWREAPGPYATPQREGDTLAIDLGAGEEVSFGADDPMRFIYFLQGTSNTYLQAEADGAEAAADALGVDLTLVDAEFDAATQRSQIQNALASGKYNGAAIRAVSTSGACAPLTEDAPAAGVPVVVVVQNICDRDRNAGPDLWSPGTLAYVGGGGGTYPFYQVWAHEVAESFSEPTTTGLIVGPSQLAAVQVVVEALEDAAADNPNMQIGPVNHTDFTDAGGLAAIQNMMQAHPDLGAVVLQYGGQTPAVIRGIKQAGKSEQIKIYEVGGDAAAKKALLAGEIEMSAAQSPYTAAYCAIELLVEAHQGSKVPRVVYNDCNTQAGDPTTTAPLLLTSDNVDDFTPDY
jgi:ribose transport system substrate-binding protein